MAPSRASSAFASAPAGGHQSGAGARSLAPLLEVAAAAVPYVPPRLAYAMCERIVGVMAPRLPAYRVVLRNLRVIMPDAAEPERERAARAVLAGIGKNYFDLLRFPSLTPAAQSRMATAEGAQHLNRALAAGHGALLVGPHTGAYTIVFAALIHQFPGRALLVVEQMTDPRVHAFMNRLRRSTKVDVEPLGPRVGRAVLKALHQNQLVILAGDRAIASNAVDVRFFGRSTPIPSGPATLALRTGAPLITGYPRRLPDNRSVVGFDPPLILERSDTLSSDVRDATQKIAYIMQAYIRRDPAQWLVAEDVWPSK